MARAKNTMETVELTLSVTKPVRNALELLTKSGLWGKNAAEAANMLIAEGLRTLLKNGELDKNELSTYASES